MNYDIEIDSMGRGALTWEKKSSNLVNVYLSVKTPKGFLTTDPDFGLDISDIKVVTEITLETLKQRYEQALVWVITARKATQITVVTSLIEGRSDGAKVIVSIIQANGVEMQFTDFIEVGGVSGGFIFP